MTSQPGILAEGNSHAYFMILKLKRNTGTKWLIGTIKQVLRSANDVSDMDRASQLYCNVGIGSRIWDLISP